MPEPMTCPECGVAMNHHADKEVRAADAGDEPIVDGTVVELHACPECGRGSARRQE